MVVNDHVDMVTGQVNVLFCKQIIKRHRCNNIGLENSFVKSAKYGKTVIMFFRVKSASSA